MKTRFRFDPLFGKIEELANQTAALNRSLEVKTTRIPVARGVDSKLERGQPCPRVPGINQVRADKAVRAPVSAFFESSLHSCASAKPGLSTID